MVSARPLEIQLTVRMLTDAATTPVPTRLRYSPDEPYAVSLIFDSPGACPIEWVFSRDLLAAGLTASSGDGDVRVWPAETGGQLFLELRSPSGQALFALEGARVRRFLAQSEQLVPRGSEGSRLDVDHAVGLLLGGDTGVAPA